MAHDPGGGELPGLVVASLTDVGRTRKNNEDAVGDPWRFPGMVVPERLAVRGFLLAVADGMGGHADGEVASRLAVETLFRSFYAGAGELGDDLRQAVEDADTAVRGGPADASIPLRASELRMGTTLVAAVVAPEVLHVANVGDSRAYLFHEGRLAQVTRDHSLVAEEVRAGILTPAEALRFPYRNVVTRALGGEGSAEVELFRVPWAEGDRLLLCSDGLHGPVPDDLILEALRDLHPAEAVQALVRIANARGGPDNISVIVAESRRG